MVIDFHVHIFEPGTIYDYAFEKMKDINPFFLTYYQDISISPGLLVNYLKNEGLDFAVIMGTNEPVSFGVTSNDYVGNFCSKYSFYFPFYCLDPLNYNSISKEIDKAFFDFRFKGIKILPSSGFFHPNNFDIYWIFKKSSELKTPVLIHTGTNNFKGVRNEYALCRYIEEVAVDFPKLSIILAHGGRGFEYQHAFYMARQCKNVFLEISGLPPKKILSYYPELEKIHEKVIFGSDWPGIPGTINENIIKIKSLPLSTRAIDNILGRNAAKVLFN